MNSSEQRVVCRRGEEGMKDPGVYSYIDLPNPTRVRRVSEKRKVIVRFFTTTAPAPRKNRGAWDPSYFLSKNRVDVRVTHRYKDGREPR
jgi:hypothetical protein